MSLFPSAGHLLSWAGFVPRLDESAGKSRSTRSRKGAPWLKPVLVQAAWEATRKKNSYFQRHGAKKAAIAVAASILTTVYHMLRDGTCYKTSALNTSPVATRRKPRPDWPIASAISATTLKLGLLHEAPDAGDRLSWRRFGGDRREQPGDIAQDLTSCTCYSQSNRRRGSKMS